MGSVRFAIALLVPLASCQWFLQREDDAAAQDGGLAADGGIADGNGAEPTVDGTPSADGACQDTASNPRHCGACGRDCLNGECKGGRCVPFVLTEVSNPRELVMVDDDVYFVAELPDATNHVARVPKAGGPPTRVSPDETVIRNIVLHTAYIYYSGDSVKRLRKDATRLEAEYVFNAGARYNTSGFAIWGSDLYAAIYAGSGSLWKCPKDPSPMAELVDGSYPLRWATAVTATNEGFFTGDGIASGTGPFIRRLKGGGVADVVAASLMGRSTSDDTHVWFTRHDDAVLRLPLDVPAYTVGDPPIVPFAKGAGPAGDLILDATHVYWITTESSGFLHRAPKAGGPVETLVSDLRSAAGLAGDDRRVCWGETDLDQIRCLAKSAALNSSFARGLPW